MEELTPNEQFERDIMASPAEGLLFKIMQELHCRWIYGFITMGDDGQMRHDIRGRCSDFEKGKITADQLAFEIENREAFGQLRIKNLFQVVANGALDVKREFYYLLMTTKLQH